jgi:tetratricopeptide (TPR) repeat protein
MKSLIKAIAVGLLLRGSRTEADVIYLTNGNVLVVEKVWEEGVEIRYQTGGIVQILQKSSVKRIQAQKAIPAPEPEGATPRYGIAINGSTPATVETPTPSSSTVLRGSASAVSKELLNQLRENLKSAPGDPHAKSELAQALNSLASLQAAQGDLPAAKNSLEEARRLTEKDLAILTNLAIVNYRTGNYRASEDLLLACVEMNKRDQETHYLLGEAYYAQEKVA